MLMCISYDLQHEHYAALMSVLNVVSMSFSMCSPSGARESNLARAESR